MEFNDIKSVLESGLYDALPPDTNAVFQMVHLSDWIGECPSPGAYARKNNSTDHRVEVSRFCLDCYKIHVLNKDMEKLTLDILHENVKYIVSSFHKRTAL
ncbi:hypothetical protein LCGC14_1259260 [marine sediment metagenome]|uniref:Uncharacterized protein n=1 Tax=marine sediment metagenome TaxID=412755 RepID=A0A0F9L3P5_9ZZZZ